MQKAGRLVLVGGGSGGHIVPNLAIASELISNSGAAPVSRGADGAHLSLEILYIGSRLPLDRQLVEAAGLQFSSIFTGKLRRYFSWRNFIDPFFLLMGFFQSLYLLIRFKPHVIFSKGGYVSVPVALAGFFLRIPIILHESDSRMGLANRLVARFAQLICVSFPHVIPESKKVEFTGNPIRSEVATGDSKKGYKLTGFSSKKPVLLVWGGSLGAQQINRLIQSELDVLTDYFQVIHVTGKGKGLSVQRSGYIAYDYVGDELKDLYAITDLVVGRAGANSLYELAYLQIPNVCIPLRINQDQLKNADYFQEKGATCIFDEKTPLFNQLKELWENKKGLNEMKRSLKKVARPHATSDLVDLILKEIY